MNSNRSFNHSRHLPRGGLYVLADSSVVRPNRLASSVAAAIDGGAVLVQYRDKSDDTVRRWREAKQLQQICRDTGATFVINDDVELAAAIEADGVHLGRHDMETARARAHLPVDAIVGVSCYDALGRAETAVGHGATYVAFGSFFASPTKPAATRASVDLLAAARQRLTVPIVAIGGITPENGAELLTAGANFLAVISGVFAAADVKQAARAYARLFT